MVDRYLTDCEYSEVRAGVEVLVNGIIADDRSEAELYYYSENSFTCVPVKILGVN